MRRILNGVIACLLLVLPPAMAQVRLNPGQLATRNVPPSLNPALFNGEQGFFVDVPDDAIRVVFELTTSPPEASVDLYVRLSEDVQLTATGEVLSDFRSQGPTGTERIELTSASAPPLQAGRYFVAVGSGANSGETFAFLRVVIETFIATDVIQIAKSDFEGSIDSWERNYPAPLLDVPGFTLGDAGSLITAARDQTGERSRFLQLQSKGDQDAFVVGKQFLGKLALLGPDARIEFDLRYRPPQSFATQNVELKLFSRFTVYRWSTEKPPKEFIRYVVPLRASSWQLISGSDSFEQALENVLRIEIRANYGHVDGLTGLDNFTLLGRAPTPRVPLLSDFDSAVQGWTRNFPDAPFLTPRAFGVTAGDQRTVVRQFNTDGNPGGYLQITDSDDTNQDFLLAPEGYLGDLVALGSDAAFEFDRRHTSNFGAARPVEIRLIGFGAAYRFFGPLATREWAHYRAPLTAENWSVIEGDRSFEQTLRAVQRIEVSVDDVLGAEITGFDNFRLTGNPANVPLLSAAPESVSFVAELGGGAPAGQVVDVTSDSGGVSWSAHASSDAPWIQLEQSGGGVTPGALVVRVNPAGLARGVHTGSVTIDWSGAPQPIVIPVRLTMIFSTTPLISQGGVVNSATYTPNDQPGGELSGGMFVAIFGQRLAPSIAQASAIPFPGSLAGTSATMGGRPVPLVYVSPTQIVGVVPQALTQVNAVAQSAPVAAADLTVIQNGDESAIETVRLKPVQPLIFTQNQTGTGLGAIQNVGFNRVQLNTFDTPARPGEAITVYATGLGPTQTAVPDGFAASGANAITGQAQITIGGISSTPLFAGLSPNSPHLYQVNATVAEDSPTGCAVPVRITVDGVPSNEVTMAVTADGSPCR